MIAHALLLATLSLNQQAIAPQLIQSAIAASVAESPKPKPVIIDDPDTKRSRVLRWTGMLAAGLVDGYTTNQAMRNGFPEGGLLAKHFVHKPGLSPYVYALAMKTIFAKLYDVAAQHKKTQANVAAAMNVGWNIPAIVGNINNAQVRR